MQLMLEHQQRLVHAEGAPALLKPIQEPQLATNWLGTALQAVAAVLQQDQSAIVTLASSSISRPSQLDDKVYASYGAR